MNDELMHKLEERLGPLHARQRLGIEKDHEAQVFGQGLPFFHLENWYSALAIIRTILKLTGLYWRAQRNAESIVVSRNDLTFSTLPPAFDCLTILYISDLHADMNEAAMGNLALLVKGMHYDLCVLTGDYRGKTFGAFEPALAGVAMVRELTSVGLSMACSAITIPFKWFRRWKPWASKYCSTNAEPSHVEISASI